MASASVSSVPTDGVIRLPSYELLPTSLLKGLEDAALAILNSDSVHGDLFNMSRADKVALADVEPDAVILIPLFVTADAAVINSDSLAAGPLVYIRLDSPPQPRAIFGTCVAYSEGAGDREVAVGARVYFPPLAHLLVAKPSLIDLFVEASGTARDNPRNGEPRPVKKLCTRPLVGFGEPADSTQDLTVEKGTQKYILDLDGCRHTTRNKSEIALREKELGFVFRAVDRARWTHIMGNDFMLQVGYYKTTVMEQASIRANRRHEAFVSCGYLDRVQDLEFIHTSERLKLLLTGQILVEGGQATLTLDDFANGEILSRCKDVCPAQNRPLVVVLKNIQTVLQVFLSSEFEGVFDEFIDDLEGAERPMELVSADFLVYSVEVCLRKYFRQVSSERSDMGILTFPVTDPEECAIYLNSLFDQLSMDLSDFHSRAIEEEYYRAHVIRETRNAAKTPTPKKTTSSNPDRPERPTRGADRPKEAPTKTCAGHLGRQLKAAYTDGRPYKCAFGKSCKFRHIGKVGKTKAEMLEIISLLPTTAKEDLTRAMSKTA